MLRLKKTSGHPSQVGTCAERPEGVEALAERYNGTIRHGNSRKARKVYAFSKEFGAHLAMSWFAMAYYNFCRPHLGLRIRRDDGRWIRRSPAMAAALSDHIWTLVEFMQYPLIHKTLPAS